MPESFFDPDKGEIKGADLRAHLDELATFKAAEDSRKLTLPAAPAAYQPVLPEGFTPPVGVEFKLDTSDPIIAQAQAMAHAKGMSQGDFSDMLGLYATAKLGEAVQYETAKTAALAGLGTTGPQRIDAVTRWLGANFPEATVKPVLATLATQQHVEMFEKIISKLTNQGTGNFRQTGREVDTGKLTPEQYDKLSYGEKKAYAAKHSGQAA